MTRPATTRNDERRPLLQDEEDQRTPTGQCSALPSIQFAVLCFMRVLDPLNFTQIFPYINEFVAGLHLTEDPSQIGFYSGMIESVFALCQLIAIYPWASLSDRVGRVKVITAGSVGLTISTLFFGVSRTFWAALASRALAGLFSGNISVVPTVLCEITNPANEHFVFPVFGMFFPLGMIIGPLIGGSLSNPAMKSIPIFDNSLFRAYPYLLPCLVIAGINFVGVLITYLFLDETVKTREALVVADKPMSTKDLLGVPMIRCLCTSACFLSFISTAFDVIFVLFCYSPIKAGGLALEAQQIGYALAISGATSALFQIVAMPTLLRRLDHAQFYHLCITIWPIVFISLPLLNVFARCVVDSTTESIDRFHTAILWLGIGVVLVISKIGFLPYSINTLLIKKYSPSASALGASIGLIQFFICLSRSFSPFVSSSLFVLTVEHDILVGYGWAFSLAVVSLGGSYFSWCIVTESERIRG